MKRASKRTSDWGSALVASLTEEQRARLVDPLAPTLSVVPAPGRPIEIAARTVTVGVASITLRFTLDAAAPRTKNTGMSPRPGVVVPSKSYRAWLAAVRPQAEAIRAHYAMMGLRLPLDGPVDVTAVFYRDRNVGDEDRFVVACGDMLQACGFVLNDSQIHWTGDTRRELDRDRPRVECTITTRGAT